GIIHQIHLEQVAAITLLDQAHTPALAFPDFAIGGDSHTPMVNALGVLGWGVGGIEIETVVLGEPYVIPKPEFVGVRLDGTPAAPTRTLRWSRRTPARPASFATSARPIRPTTGSLRSISPASAAASPVRACRIYGRIQRRSPRAFGRAPARPKPASHPPRC